jgi:hypothetical protein
VRDLVDQCRFAGAGFAGEQEGTAKIKCGVDGEDHGLAGQERLRAESVLVDIEALREFE